MFINTVIVVVVALTVILIPDVAEAASMPQNASAPESNLTFLFASFAITWAGFFAYVTYVYLRQRELGREIRTLTKLIEDTQAAQDKAPLP